MKDAVIDIAIVAVIVLAMLAELIFALRRRDRRTTTKEGA